MECTRSLSNIRSKLPNNIQAMRRAIIAGNKKELWELFTNNSSKLCSYEFNKMLILGAKHGQIQLVIDMMKLLPHYNWDFNSIVDAAIRNNDSSVFQILDYVLDLKCAFCHKGISCKEYLSNLEQSIPDYRIGGVSVYDDYLDSLSDYQSINVDEWGFPEYDKDQFEKVQPTKSGIKDSSKTSKICQDLRRCSEDYRGDCLCGKNYIFDLDDTVLSCIEKGNIGIIIDLIDQYPYFDWNIQKIAYEGALNNNHELVFHMLDYFDNEISINSLLYAAAHGNHTNLIYNIHDRYQELVDLNYVCYGYCASDNNEMLYEIFYQFPNFQFNYRRMIQYAEKYHNMEIAYDLRNLLR